MENYTDWINWFIIGYRGTKGEPGPKGECNNWVHFFLIFINLCFIGEPGRSIPGPPGIDGYPGQSGLPGAKGKSIDHKLNIFMNSLL